MLQKILNAINDFLYTFVYTLLNLPRDLNAVVLFVKIKRKLGYLDEADVSVAEYFGKWVREQPDKACIIYNDVTWTFQDV